MASRPARFLSTSSRQQAGSQVLYLRGEIDVSAAGSLDGRPRFDARRDRVDRRLRCTAARTELHLGCHAREDTRSRSQSTRPRPKLAPVVVKVAKAPGRRPSSPSSGVAERFLSVAVAAGSLPACKESMLFRRLGRDARRYHEKSRSLGAFQHIPAPRLIRPVLHVANPTAGIPSRSIARTHTGRSPSRCRPVPRSEHHVAYGTGICRKTRGASARDIIRNGNAGPISVIRGSDRTSSGLRSGRGSASTSHSTMRRSVVTPAFRASVRGPYMSRTTRRDVAQP